MRIPLLISGVLVGLIALLSTTSLDALTINNGTQRIAVVQERVRTDRDVQLTLMGQAIQNGDRSANVESCPGRPASSSGRVIRNDLVKDNLIYRVRLEEVSINDWPSDRIYRVDVYGDGNRISSLFFDNRNADDTVLEAVRVYVDLGIQDPRDGPETYSTIVTRLNECT